MYACFDRLSMTRVVAPTGIELFAGRDGSGAFLTISRHGIPLRPPSPGSLADIGLIDNPLDIIYYADIMPKGEYLGEFEHIVLLTILRLGDGAYGAIIRSEIERVTGRSPAIGTVHATLERLERKNFVASWTGEPTAERGGKAKRHFKVEADGISALKNAQQTLERLHAGVLLRNARA